LIINILKVEMTLEKIVEILTEIRQGVDWHAESALIDDGLLDSFDVISLVGELEEAFGVKIGLEHLEPENFNSVAAIKSLLESLGVNS